MQNDIALFSELCDELFKTELIQPVAKPIPTSELYQRLDLSLNAKGLIDDELKTTLKQIIKSTPKTASKSFAQDKKPCSFNIRRFFEAEVSISIPR